LATGLLVGVGHGLGCLGSTLHAELGLGVQLLATAAAPVLVLHHLDNVVVALNRSRGSARGLDLGLGLVRSTAPLVLHPETHQNLASPCVHATGALVTSRALNSRIFVTGNVEARITTTITTIPFLLSKPPQIVVVISPSTSVQFFGVPLEAICFLHFVFDVLLVGAGNDKANHKKHKHQDNEGPTPAGHVVVAASCGVGVCIGVVT